jgi:hypothetical protein
MLKINLNAWQTCHNLSKFQMRLCGSKKPSLILNYPPVFVKNPSPILNYLIAKVTEPYGG